MAWRPPEPQKGPQRREPPPLRRRRVPGWVVALVVVALVLVALIANNWNEDKGGGPRLENCEAVAREPSLTPGDWERLVKRSAEPGQNREEVWAGFKAYIARQCPELLVRVTGS